MTNIGGTKNKLFRAGASEVLCGDYGSWGRGRIKYKDRCLKVLREHGLFDWSRQMRASFQFVPADTLCCTIAYLAFFSVEGPDIQAPLPSPALPPDWRPYTFIAQPGYLYETPEECSGISPASPYCWDFSAVRADQCQNIREGRSRTSWSGGTNFRPLFPKFSIIVVHLFFPIPIPVITPCASHSLGSGEEMILPRLLIS